MSYRLETLTADCYEGTSCLINKWNIRDENQLSRIEADITFAKLSELERHPIEGQFDFAHYKAIHRYLFEDLYSWAGQIRTVDISKKGTAFVKAKDIVPLAERCFARLKNQNYFVGLPFDALVAHIVDFYGTTNMLHPFREGNGRTQRAFLSQLIRKTGHELNFAALDSDELMVATIQAAHGVNDGLYRIFHDSITKKTKEASNP